MKGYNRGDMGSILSNFVLILKIAVCLDSF